MRLLAILAAMILATPARAQFNTAPWQGDLAQLSAALDRDYANLDWLTGERGFDLDRAIADTRTRIGRAGNEAEARAAFDQLVRKIGDGHVDLQWPSAARPAPLSATAQDACTRLNFNTALVTPGIADQLPDYRPRPPRSVFPAGTAEVGGARLGIVRIGIFDPHGFPSLCRAALAASPKADKDTVLTAAYREMTRGLGAQLADLRAAGAEVLLVDLSSNGGGTEWAETAVRMVTAQPLRSARIAVMPDDAWRASQRELAVTLRQRAHGSIRAKLLALAADVERNSAKCTRDCPRLVANGFATGLIDGAEVDPALPVEVDSTVQYAAPRGVWSGPLLVLVDDETWSAAEEFAAELQDHRAAVVVGARTGGAGCGHATDRGPVVLTHSQATLSLPDCVRYRRDGSNEVRGVVPDVPVAMRQNDAAAFKARLIAAALPAAIALARPNWARPNSPRPRSPGH